MRARSDGGLLEARVDDIARRLRDVEERLGDRAEHHAESSIAESRQAKPYLTAREAASYLSVSRSLLSRWRCDTPGGPPYRKVGRRVVYASADLDKFLEDRCRSRPLLNR